MTSRAAPPAAPRQEARADRVAHGDWQTPPALAAAVVAAIRRTGLRPRVILEPTCGEGAFLVAARAAFPDASLVGFDVSTTHVAAARVALKGTGARIERRDFFEVDWSAELGALHAPLLVVGNPPWVTNAALGALGSQNLPTKHNADGARGVDAITGSSNFDIAEAMTVRLLDAAVERARPFVLALLVKRAVARKVARRALARGLAVSGAIHGIDARRTFGVSVDAALLVVEGPAEAGWAERATLAPDAAVAPLTLAQGKLARATEDLFATTDLEATGAPSPFVWRSGVKHDCADVMEIDRVAVNLEDTFVFPLLKGTDVASGQLAPRRSVIVPQRRTGEDTRVVAERAPRTWAYLEQHAARLAARRSRVYAGRPPFSIFGVGPYAFAPFKVATSGLHKKLSFAVVPPFEGRPVMLDDTCYFVACDDELTARAVHAALTSHRATRFFEARVAWDEKRPITKALLARLRLETLLRG